MTRGLTVVSTLEQLVGTLTAELKQKAVVLGWCIELLQAYFLIADDLMDQSVTRRGAPCWYRMPRVRRVLSRSLVRLAARRCIRLDCCCSAEVPCWRPYLGGSSL